MSLSSIVALTISIESAKLSRAGFGTPLIAAYTSVFADRVKSYGSLTEMTDDGFATTDPAYKCAAKVFGQNPSPSIVKIGRRTRAYSQSVDLIPTETTEGFVYEFSIVSPDGSVTAISYTVGAGADVEAVCDGLNPLIDAATDVSATDNTTHITIDADNAGELFDITGIKGKNSGFELADGTADPGIAADLAEIAAFDADWYGLLLDYGGQLTHVAAAAWAETQRVLLGVDFTVTDCEDGASTTDEAYLLKNSAYSRTFGYYGRDSLLHYSAAAAMGEAFPYAPGSQTWAYKTLAGVAASNLSTGGQNALKAKNANYNVAISSVNTTLWGTVASGEYIDVIRGIDWLYVRMQEDVFAALKSVRKVPYTDIGVASMQSTIDARLQAAVAAGVLAAEPAPSVTVPRVADVSAVDKANRLLPDVTFSGTLAGAIHELAIAGTVSV